jgi:hypothetical protein
MMPFGSTKALKYFLYPLLGAVIIALSLDQTFEHFVFPYRNTIDNSYKVERLLTKEAPDEIPIFGSSKGRSALIPDSLGKNVFNYSMEKCNFDVISFLLKTELAKDKTTPIIIEFNARSFVHKPSHTIDLATFVPNGEHKSVRDYLKENGRLDKYQMIPGVRYFGSYLRYLRSLSRKVTSKKIISRGGIFMDTYPGDELLNRFTTSRYEMIKRRNRLEEKEASGVPLTYMENQTLEMLQISLDFTFNKGKIEEFEALAKEHPNRDILIVYTPHHPSELKGIKNTEQLHALLNHWRKDIDNIHVFDYSAFPLENDCFKNSSHINLKGARLFCEVLNDELAPFLQPE